MEVIAALGLGAKELFNYNRENYKFDQDQRIERESLRLEMQVKRFELFREDVRDLVTLTVDRMDVYHLVGALFLEFCIVLFCEGRVQASAPPFLLSLFLLSNACAFIYLLLAVWLSMHASIASHSFGVRLLTRFVRLPIPSVKQLDALRFQLKDYEGQGMANLMRLPFLDRKGQSWKKVNSETVGSSPTSFDHSTSQGAMGQSPSGSMPEASGPPTLGRTGSTGSLRRGNSLAAAPPTASAGAASPGLLRPTQSQVLGSSSSAGAATGATGGKEPPFGTQPPAGNDQPEVGDNFENLLPEEEDIPFGGEDLLSSNTGALPERHVQLFRELQSKWQCYDAYCRVCMGLGVNQILQGLSYYAVCHTLVENHSPTTGFALIACFQSTTVALAVLDLAGMKPREMLAVQLVGMMPCCIAAFCISNADRDGSGTLDPKTPYRTSPLSFIFQALWLELWLRVASPSGTSSELPRRFRQVLFLDVFGDASGWNPGQEDPALIMENAQEAVDQKTWSDTGEKAESQLRLVQCAMRRWKAVPDWALSSEQRGELDLMSKRQSSCGKTIQDELDRLHKWTGDMEPRVFEDRLRPWTQLSEANRSAEAFAGCLLGPFLHDGGYETSTYHYDLEGQQCLFDDTPSTACAGAYVLELSALGDLLKDLEQAERAFLEARILRDLRLAQQKHVVPDQSQSTRQGERGRDPADAGIATPLRAFARSATSVFPNLTGILKQRRQSSLFFQGERGPATEGGPSSGAQGSGNPKRHSQEELGIEMEALRTGEAIEQSDRSAEQHVPNTRPQSAELQHGSGTGGGSGSGCGRNAGVSGGAVGKTTTMRDPTLVAMAGKHAKHFVPERLPWQVLKGMTRVLQMCWLGMGLIFFFKVTKVYEVDFQRPGRGGEGERLCVYRDMSFEQLTVQWPYGSMFNPQSLVCDSSRPEELLVASPFALYRSRSASPGLLELEVLDQSRLSSSTVVFRAPRAAGKLPSSPADSASPFFFAVPNPRGVALQLVGGDRREGAEPARVLPVDGPPWQVMGGGVVNCTKVKGLSCAADLQRAEWCLLLAGWDGGMLPIGIVPLAPSGHPGGALLPVDGEVVRPCLDAPVDTEDAKRGITALHVEPRFGRLWILYAGGKLEAWDLLNSRSLGSWEPHWSLGAGDFRPVAICDADEGGLYTVGRSKARGPSLLRTPLPFAASAASTFMLEEGGAVQTSS